jgi:hypothetical protein
MYYGTNASDSFDAILHMARMDFDVPTYKRFYRMTYEFEAGSSVSIQCGFAVDDGAVVTPLETVSQAGTFKLTIPVQRTAICIAPYVKVTGAPPDLQLIAIELEYEICGTRGPRNQ